MHTKAAFLLAIPLAAQTTLPPPATMKVDFIRDVEPILTQKCHSATERKSSRPAFDWTVGKPPCVAVTTAP
jgi:hypothetical protein